MSRDPDLHHAISLRPLPFFERVSVDSDRRPSSVPPRPAGPASSAFAPDNVALPAASKPAASTSVHAVDVTEAHERAGYAHSAASSDNGRSSTDDVESARLPSYSASGVHDPFHLASKIQTQQQIDGIRANSSRKRVALGTSATRARRLRHFYETQNENIERLLKPVDDHRREARDEAGSDHLKYKIAVNGSFVANVLLAALQIYGATSSQSLSLFTTMADAIFDPMSNLTLILCNRAVNRVDPRRFPSGKARIETAGNIFFCFLMTSVSLILIAMSIRELAEGSTSGTTDFHLPSVIAVAVAFTTKLCLFLYCWALRNKYSQIRILWEDHRNDLFINGFGLLTSVGGSKLRWWIDPMGAILLACLISFLWMRTAYSEFQLLIGVTADTSTLQLITYISMTHSPDVKGIDTVRAWHSGPRLIVEVDIVMDERRSLKATHDTAEELQTKLESLPDVERAYVHVDYETSHRPEHFLKKQL